MVESISLLKQRCVRTHLGRLDASRGRLQVCPKADRSREYIQTQTRLSRAIGSDHQEYPPRLATAAPGRHEHHGIFDKVEISTRSTARYQGRVI